MALDSNLLKAQLETDWLVPPGGSYPDDAQASGERFASAVASWFSLAQANGILCDTATDGESQLASLAALAFAGGSAAAAGQSLADALTRYIAGQKFGTGVAALPLGGAAAATAFIALFSDLQADNAARAQQLASACQTLARTSLVSFPPPTPPSSVT